jgi:hypothetical protein
MPYAAAMAWEIELTAQAEAWFMALDADDADRIAAAIDELQRQGPALGRPFVDSIKGSRHHNMKELRSIGGHLRALFAFDPARTAIVLLGGDKTNDWTGWYERNTPTGRRDLRRTPETTQKGVTCPRPRPRTGRTYARSDRSTRTRSLPTSG